MDYASYKNLIRSFQGKFQVKRYESNVELGFKNLSRDSEVAFWKRLN